jgi:nitrate/TMAO reductase-like tetraheme cytochrome c subunit
MEHKYLISKARNTVTGQTVKNQDLTGARFTLAQRVICQEVADQLAAKMTARTGDVWTGYCEAYTPTTRRV